MPTDVQRHAHRNVEAAAPRRLGHARIAERATGGAFMRGVVAAFPDRILPVLTDNGVALTNGALTRWDRMVHGFDRVDVEYR